MIPIIYADIIDDAEDLALFEEVYEEYYRQMFFKANRILNDTYEAEDAVHDAFMGIARNMKTVRAIRDKADLYYYMVRAAENAAYNRTRQTRHYANAVPLEEASVPSKRSFWNTVCNRMDYEQLVRTIAAMRGVPLRPGGVPPFAPRERRRENSPYIHGNLRLHSVNGGIIPTVERK